MQSQEYWENVFLTYSIAFVLGLEYKHLCIEYYASLHHQY